MEVAALRFAESDVQDLFRKVNILVCKDKLCGVVQHHLSVCFESSYPILFLIFAKLFSVNKNYLTIQEAQVLLEKINSYLSNWFAGFILDIDCVYHSFVADHCVMSE